MFFHHLCSAKMSELSDRAGRWKKLTFSLYSLLLSNTKWNYLILRETIRIHMLINRNSLHAHFFIGIFFLRQPEKLVVDDGFHAGFQFAALLPVGDIQFLTLQ